MDKVSIQLIVLFEEPFWIGVFEKNENHFLSVSKVMFGAQPKDYEIYEWILKNYDYLKFSPAVKDVVKEKKRNPKRLQRDISELLSKKTIGTKSQQALKLQHEEIKLQRNAFNKKNKQMERQRLFDLKQQKRKEKHKGR